VLANPLCVCSWSLIGSQVAEFVQIARDEGATVLCGGDRPDGLPEELAGGHYFAPTIIGDVESHMRIVQEEVFGPVVVVYTFKDEVRQPCGVRVAP